MSRSTRTELAPRHRPGRPGGPRARNRIKKLAALERAARYLFLRRGIAAVTVDQIVARARMAKGSFYRYVSGKEELVERLLRPLRDGAIDAFDRCREALADADRATLPLIYLRMAADLSAVVTEHPDAIRLYLQECRGPGTGDRAPVAALARELRQVAVELSELARERGLLRGPAWVSALAVVGAAEELLLAHLSGDRANARPDEVQAALVAMVLRGIAA